MGVFDYDMSNLSALLFLSMNGYPFGYIVAYRGLRQEYSFSPILLL